MPGPPPALPVTPLPKLKQCTSVDDVVANFDVIIDWAITAKNGLGYFPTVYKRATLAIRDKIEQGDYFDDNDRMTRFDIIFAQRYFDALNAYFHPQAYDAPTHTWQWCFDGHEYPEPDDPIMLQHMLTAVNSHVNLDLGIAAAMAAGDEPIARLKKDFNRINDLLAGEVGIFLVTLSTLSPRVRLIRRLLLCEDEILGEVLKIFRDLAWAFSNQIAQQPKRRRDNIAVHDAWAGVLGSYYLHPSDTVHRLVRWIGETESQDVATNIKVLDGRI
ncbi:DUF5995 family protein [Mycobacterium sp. 236(2023)]|uniref:DUF5995 family protein n=1 Tax=Mycobacterium sp. 236(2023) TaxID=3038163 RepID=UPI00241516CD|nr:DUF5995 family protein [Mycobacterium sp. 236(2023)]MDG4665693.1 DUF5995 family protein [Mycobacterium sp. 236(2023)]